MPEKIVEPAPVYQPTPTQEENDRAAVGLTPVEKEPDGSGTEVVPQPKIEEA